MPKATDRRRLSAMCLHVCTPQSVHRFANWNTLERRAASRKEKADGATVAIITTHRHNMSSAYCVVLLVLRASTAQIADMRASVHYICKYAHMYATCMSCLLYCNVLQTYVVMRPLEITARLIMRCGETQVCDLHAMLVANVHLCVCDERDLVQQ